MATVTFKAVPSPPSKLNRHVHGPESPEIPSNISFQRVVQSETSLLGIGIGIGNPINSSAYASVLDSCKCPFLGKQVHAHALKFGFHGHEFVETKLLQMYARCCCLDDTLQMFGALPDRNLYSWTALITAHLDHQLFHDALSLLLGLISSSLALEFFVFPIALKVCSGIQDVELGRQFHGVAVKYQFGFNIYVGNALIDMYGKCMSLDDAKRVLAKMPQRDHVSWNSIVTACLANGMVHEGLGYLNEMYSEDCLSPNLVTWSAVIGGFSQSGYDEEAISLLARMLESGLRPNARTLASILPSCAKMLKLGLGKEIHGYVMRHGFISNPYVVNGLVDVYRRCADMGNAEKLFSRFSLQNEISYNTMIVGYCDKGDVLKAKELYDTMVLVGIQRDTISWNSMITGYVDNLHFTEAFDLFRHLIMEDGIRPDSFTLGSVLNACADVASLTKGKEIHSQAVVRGLLSNPFVGGALVEMYCKCQDLDAAKSAFDQVKERDIATWNALISGYSRCSMAEDIRALLEDLRKDGFEPNAYTWNSILAGYVENGNHESALRLMFEMQQSGLRPDIYTIGMVVAACSKLATVERGKQAHAYSIKSRYETDAHIGVALVDMYAKCGNIEHAFLAYNRITNHNLVSQNALLTAFAMHGLGEEGIALFKRMLMEGYQPDDVTFLAVLSCCVHAGAVETGKELFDAMANFNVDATLKHYTCMIDLLSRAGMLHEAHMLIMRMPMEPDAVVWSSFLGGCVLSREVELGEIAGKRLLELEPENTGNHILLANLYAYARKWSELARTRTMMKDRGMHKSPGCSWIEDKEKVHVFLASDRSHDRAEEIYTTLQILTAHISQGT